MAASPTARQPLLAGLVALFLLSACEERGFDEFPGETVATEIARGESETPESRQAPPEHEPREGAFRFVAYNLENWLAMNRYERGQLTGSRMKPESEKQAVVSILADARPDILGLCEIGTPEDLAELQSRLREVGIDLPHAHHSGGGDPVRNLALLSRFPISRTVEHPALDYHLHNRSFTMSRGLNEAIVDTPIGPVRFLGAHLKSKRPIPDADQEQMRLKEAHLLRDRVEKIFETQPADRLIVYGDFNDTRNTPTLKAIRGPSEGADSLRMAWLKDSRGESWTQHWSYQDVYSRFDYILLSGTMNDLVEWDGSRVLDHPEWRAASDHRALLLKLRNISD